MRLQIGNLVTQYILVLLAGNGRQSGVRICYFFVQYQKIRTKQLIAKVHHGFGFLKSGCLARKRFKLEVFVFGDLKIRVSLSVQIKLHKVCLIGLFVRCKSRDGKKKENNKCEQPLHLFDRSTDARRESRRYNNRTLSWRNWYTRTL